MQALILAGGQGTRLRPLTVNTPKPIVPIGNQPFLLRQIESLKAANVLDITLSLNYQPSAIQKVLGDGSAFGVKLRYLIEPAPMGTAGAYKFADEYLKTATIVLNGDILTDLDLQTVVEQHQNQSATATIVLTRVDNPAAYGLVEINENNEVLRFLEKPKPAEIADLKTDTINSGIYILEPEVLGFIPKNANYSFEYQLFPDLLQRRKAFYAFVMKQGDYWLDIGTQQRYRQAHNDLLAGKVRTFSIARDARFDRAESAQIDDKSCIANRCAIKHGARIANSFLGENVVVAENAVIENSIIWANTKIEASAVVTDAVVGYDCIIGKNAVVSNGSMLGDKTILTDFTCY